MRWEYQTTLPASWETLYVGQEATARLEMEQWTGSKFRKENIKAIYCQPVYLIYMQSALCEMLGLMNHKLE